MRSRNTMIIFLSSVLVAAGIEQAAGDDWPNWRGPEYNGISRERDWGADWENFYLNVVWEQVIGTGGSSMSVVDGRVYTMGNTGTRDDRDNYTDEDVVFCFDANTGAVLWTQSYLARLDDKNYEGGPSATPTVADGKVYTLSKRGIACCLDAIDGEIVWQEDLVGLYGISRPTWGIASSAFVDGDLVIYNVGKHGMALHAADGSLAWLTGTGISGYSTPVPFDWEGQRLLVLMGEKTFTAVKARTGEVMWNPPVAWVTGSNVNAADPVVYGNQVFISTAYGKGSALFYVDASSQITEVWSHASMQTQVNSSVLWEGYLYGPNDNGSAITCVELGTGAIKWSQGGFGLGSGLMLADGKLIILSNKGKLCIAEASPEGYLELGSGQILTSMCWTVPVLADGKIYARNTTYTRSNPGKLVCVELRTTAPRVDAGKSVVTWLKDGSTTVDLDGIVEDDTGDVTDTLWSVIQPAQDPTVDIADDEAPSTAADFVQTGVYVLELSAIDATAQKGTDRMMVRVYADSCEAAENNPSGNGTPGSYDFDSDCIETFSDFASFASERADSDNFNDLALFADQWLKDESLRTDVLYDAGKITLPAQ